MNGEKKYSMHASIVNVTLKQERVLIMIPIITLATITSTTTKLMIINNYSLKSR